MTIDTRTPPNLIKYLKTTNEPEIQNFMKNEFITEKLFNRIYNTTPFMFSKIDTEGSNFYSIVTFSRK